MMDKTDLHYWRKEARRVGCAYMVGLDFLWYPCAMNHSKAVGLRTQHAIHVLGKNPAAWQNFADWYDIDNQYGRGCGIR